MLTTERMKKTTFFATRLPSPLVRAIHAERELHNRQVQSIVTTALGAYFALPERKRANLHLDLIEKEAA